MKKDQLSELSDIRIELEEYYVASSTKTSSNFEK